MHNLYRYLELTFVAVEHPLPNLPGLLTGPTWVLVKVLPAH